MWHDIMLANKASVLGAIDLFQSNLSKMRSAIDNDDSDHLLNVFTRAKSARDHFASLISQQSYTQSMSSSTEKTMRYIVSPGGQLSGQFRVPGDKSMSHRSIMLGSIANGVTEVEGFLEGEDALATLQAFRDMGVTIEGPDNGHVRIHGVGLHGLKAPAGELYVGNAGTAMRPMIIKGGKPQAIHYDMPMASAQVKSCVLLAGLYAQGTTSVVEPAPTRDHTERMLRGFGYEVKTDGAHVSLQGGGELNAVAIDVPADISSAAFFMVAASIAPGSDITLQHVGINPTRDGIISILRLMGADITLSNQREVGGEPVADIRVKYAPLNGIDIPEEFVPLAIDEFPVLFVAASCAQGKTVLTGAEELRVKESDRIQVMADGLQTLGIDAQPTPDGMVIVGGQLGEGAVETHDDHRIAMSFTVAALRSSGPIVVNNCAHVATSFPGFVQLAQQTGIRIEEQVV